MVSLLHSLTCAQDSQFRAIHGTLTLRFCFHVYRLDMRSVDSVDRESVCTVDRESVCTVDGGSVCTVDRESVCTVDRL